MAQIAHVDAVEEDSLTYEQQVIAKKTFEDQFVQEYKAETADLDVDSKVLHFQILGHPARVWSPWNVVLLLPVTVKTGQNNNYTNPAAAADGAAAHARFKNMAGLDIIERVRVKAKGQHEVEYVNPRLMGLTEKLRFLFQFSKEEKEDERLFYEQFISWELDQLQSELSTACGVTVAERTTRPFQLVTKLEELTYDRYHTLRLKLPSGWFENASMLPSNMSFDVTVELASNNKMLIARVGDNAGAGALPAGALGTPKYRIDHLNIRLQIIYNTLLDSKDENGR